MTSTPIVTGSDRPGEVRGGRPFVAQVQRRIRLLDLAVILLSIGVALSLGWGWGGPLPEDRTRQVLALALAVLWPTSLWQVQSTVTTILGQGLEEYRRVIVATAWTAMFVASAAYLTSTVRGRWFLLGTLLLGTGALLLERRLMRVHLHRQLAKGQSLHRVFVIAAPVREGSIRASFGQGDARFQIVGSWLLNGSGDPDPADIVARASAVQADTIVYAPLGTEDTHWTRRLGWAMEASDLSLLVSPSLVEIAGPRLSVEPVEGLALVRVDMPKFSGPARVVKRAVDVLGSLFVLLILGIPMVAIAWLIRRDSEGPAIFKQPRAGVRSGTFDCWKFRTMYTGADAERAALRAAASQEAVPGAMVEGAIFKLVADPRITRTGRWLRRFSLDELPQLVNVLKGEMSLVGPRPHPLDDVERYDDVATRRLLAKPGMTGLWQVSGRSDLDWEESVRLDLYYVENWSLATDLLILLRTVKVVVAGSGAY